jgi:hypothetical protein
VAAELAARRIVRARAPSLGDLPALLVAEAYGGRLTDRNDPGCEVVAEDRRIVVRAKPVGAVPTRPRQFGPIADSDFDLAVLMLVDATTYDVVQAVELPADAVRGLGRDVAPYKVAVSDDLVAGPGAVDVTELVAKALATIDAERFARRTGDDGGVPAQRRPTGWCHCGCGKAVVDPGALFYVSHDRRAGSPELRERYGSIRGLVIETE